MCMCAVMCWLWHTWYCVWPWRQDCEDIEWSLQVGLWISTWWWWGRPVRITKVCTAHPQGSRNLDILIQTVSLYTKGRQTEKAHREAGRLETKSQIMSRCPTSRRTTPKRNQINMKSKLGAQGTDMTGKQAQERRNRNRTGGWEQAEQHRLKKQMNYNKVQVERHCERGGADDADVRQVWGRGTGEQEVQSDNKRQYRGYNYKIKPWVMNQET